VPALPQIATPLTEGSIFVRPFECGDIAAVTVACQDREISKWTATIPWPYREDHASGWIRTHTDLWERGEGAEFAITRAPTDDFVGAIGLRPIDWKSRKAVVGYWVAAWARNDGVATKALTLVTDWAFQDVGLEVVELQTMIGNRASERVAEKAGFDLLATTSDAQHPIAGGERFNVKQWARAAGRFK
jgi:RimJ/RimL family protein N-acetyltransferase